MENNDNKDEKDIIIEKLSNQNEMLVKSFTDALQREQEKSEITIKTVKEISKHYNTKEGIIAVVALILLFALIVTIGLS